MKKTSWYLILSFALIFLSLALYISMILVFKKPEETIYYFFQDLSFVPINVLLVALILDKLLQRKEKEALIHKLNMVIGVFFNEMGNPLIKQLLSLCKDAQYLRENLQIDAEWSMRNFSEKVKKFQNYEYTIKVKNTDVERLKKFLNGKKNLLLQLMENPNLMEHDSFTDLLLALFHLSEELSQRKDLKSLPESDLLHLAGDIQRVYKFIISEWLNYMKHLKKEYPFLFSLAVRTNPFNKVTTVIVS